MKRRAALITGGSRGIGLGIAQALASEGWNLAINGTREAEAVQETLDGLRAFGVTVVYCPGDIGKRADRENILDGTLSAFGVLDALVNNAGVAPRERRDLLEMREDSYDWVMDVNLKGPFFLSQLVARHMEEAKASDSQYSGAIVNISSISATVVSINRGEYCISKAGMSMMTQLFAARLGAVGIPVYEVRPGVTKTDMTAVVTEKYDRLIAEGLCVTPRWGYPEDVGKAVASLLRGDFPYSTGQIIMVDGGLTMPRL